MDLSAIEDVNVDDLFSINNDKPTESRQSLPLEEAPLQPEQITDNEQNVNNNNNNILSEAQPQQTQQTQPEQTQPQLAPQTQPQTQPQPQVQPQPQPQAQPQQQAQVEYKEHKEYKEEKKQAQESKNEFIDIEYENKNDTTNELNDIDNDNDMIDFALIDLPNVDSLQPDELCTCIQHTINKMTQFDPVKDNRIIMAYKQNLIQQLEKLQNISAAIDSLNNMQSTAENLPKNGKTGYPNIQAINLALREHCFFAEQRNVFGMLLIEICDINKLKQKYSNEYTNQLLSKMCQTIASEFIYEHLLFHFSANRLVVLVYIENEKELMMCGKEIIRLLTSHSYEINDQILHSNISIGAAIYENGNEINSNSNGKLNNEPFDFRDWLKNAELGVNKANNSPLNNQCAICKENDVIAAIIPSMSDNNSTSNHNKHNKSTLSLLARSRDRTHSTGASSHGLLNEMVAKYTPKEMRASIRLYDKLSRLKTNDVDDNDNNYKLIALSLCRRLKKAGANYNFQHPKYNGNSILMLCCIQNIEIIVKYFCIKLFEEINFGLMNNDGNNALMCAILNKNIGNDVVKLIAEKTTDKFFMNHNGENAVQLAQKMGRNDLIALLQ